MNKTMTALPILASLCAGAPLRAEEPVLPWVGNYEVTVKLELPHIEDAIVAAKMKTICVTACDIERGGLPALSDLNPLRKCAASHVIWNGLLALDKSCRSFVVPGDHACDGSAFDLHLGALLSYAIFFVILMESGAWGQGCRVLPVNSLLGHTAQDTSCLGPYFIPGLFRDRVVRGTRLFPFCPIAPAREAR